MFSSEMSISVPVHKHLFGLVCFFAPWTNDTAGNTVSMILQPGTARGGI